MTKPSLISETEYDHLKYFVERAFDASYSIERNVYNKKSEKIIARLLKEKFNKDVFKLADYISKNSKIQKYMIANVNLVAEAEAIIEISDKDEILDVDKYVCKNFDMNYCAPIDVQFNRIDAEIHERFVMQAASAE